MRYGYVLVVGAVQNGRIVGLIRVRYLSDTTEAFLARVTAEHTAQGYETIELTDAPDFDGTEGSLMDRLVIGRDPIVLGDRHAWTSPPPPVVLRIKKTSFIDILTPAEYVAMLGPQTDPQLAWGVGLYDAASDPFLTEDPQVEMLLNYCASTGVLTQARANQIYAEMIAASKPFPA